MSDQKDWFVGLVVEEDMMDSAFAALETSDLAQNVDTGLAALASDQDNGGIMRGLVVSNPAGLDVDVTAGAAYDDQGRRAALATTTTVTLSQTGSTTPGSGDVPAGGVPTTPGAGLKRWVTLFIAFDRDLQEIRTDGTGADVYFERIESFRFDVTQGTPAAVPTNFAPLQAGKLLLGDFRVTDAGTIDLIQTDRRQVWIRTAGSPTFVRSGVGFPVRGFEEGDGVRTALLKLLGYYNDHVNNAAPFDQHASASIAYAGSGPWADGSVVGVGTVEAALDEVVSDLGTSGGTAKVQGDATVTGGVDDLTTDRLDNQLLQLVQFVNDRLELSASAGVQTVQDGIVVTAATAGAHGVDATGAGAGTGGVFVGGSGSGRGIEATGGGPNGLGARVQAAGSGVGLSVSSTTGKGITVQTSSGFGLDIATTNGKGIEVTLASGVAAGIDVTHSGTGDAVVATATTGRGVHGIATGNINGGVEGSNDTGSGPGVYGYTFGGGSGPGVLGISDSAPTGAAGVRGQNSAIGGYGVYGFNTAAAGVGVRGDGGAAGIGVFGSGAAGVSGSTAVAGLGGAGTTGLGGQGVLGQGGASASGEGGVGVQGAGGSPDGAGALGVGFGGTTPTTFANEGIYGVGGTGGVGVRGTGDAGGAGVTGEGGPSAGSIGVVGANATGYGVFGFTTDTTGGAYYGVAGLGHFFGTGTHVGVYGEGGAGKSGVQGQGGTGSGRGGTFTGGAPDGDGLTATGDGDGSGINTSATGTGAVINVTKTAGSGEGIAIVMTGSNGRGITIIPDNVATRHASMNLGLLSADPTSLSDGDFWIEDTGVVQNLKVRLNGTTVTIASA